MNIGKAEWMIPLSGGGKAPERCIYCGKSVPHLYIQRAVDGNGTTERCLP